MSQGDFNSEISQREVTFTEVNYIPWTEYCVKKLNRYRVSYEINEINPLGTLHS